MKFLYVAIAFLFIQCWPADAANQNCMNDYYRAKLPVCLDSILSQFREAPRPKSDPPTMIGFLGQLFRTSSDEKQRVLRAESSEYLRGLYLVALYRAGLFDDAENFARRYSILPGLRNLEIMRPTPLAEVRPSSAPADNDLLIGAYMASGDTVFIERILENFSNAADSMASDGLRMGFLQSKFGPTLAPKERQSVTVGAACAKYQCKTDPAPLYRLLTLSSAFWALQSLGKTDEGIRKTSAGFFERNKRLKNLLAEEQAASGNYMTALVALGTLKSDHSSPDADPAFMAMSKAASAYENLASARDAFAPFQELVKSKQPK